MRSDGQDVIRCKNCGSNKIEVSSIGCGILALGLILVAVGAWIPIVGWFYMVPAGGFIMVLGLLAPIFIKNKNVTCKSCGHQFSVNKEVYQEYKKRIQ